MTLDAMLSIDRCDLQEAAKTLTQIDIAQLVEWLSLKDDNTRYQAFLSLQYRSQFADDVYPYWHVFQDKLRSDNSYQRSIGLMLIAENARWDADNKMHGLIDEYLLALNDEKPITIRQCIQSLGKIVACNLAVATKVADRLTSLDISAIKETMRKSILIDIINVLLIIRQAYRTEAIDNFILNELSGGILDKKAKKQIEGRLS